MRNCNSCYKYPFCEKCESPRGTCNDYKSKRVMLEKLENKGEHHGRL